MKKRILEQCYAGSCGFGRSAGIGGVRGKVIGRHYLHGSCDSILKRDVEGRTSPAVASLRGHGHGNDQRLLVHVTLRERLQ